MFIVTPKACPYRQRTVSGLPLQKEKIRFFSFFIRITLSHVRTFSLYQIEYKGKRIFYFQPPIKHKIKASANNIMFISSIGKCNESYVSTYSPKKIATFFFLLGEFSITLFIKYQRQYCETDLIGARLEDFVGEKWVNHRPDNTLELGGRVNHTSIVGEHPAQHQLMSCSGMTGFWGTDVMMRKLCCTEMLRSASYCWTVHLAD